MGNLYPVFAYRDEYHTCSCDCLYCVCVWCVQFCMYSYCVNVWHAMVWLCVRARICKRWARYAKPLQPPNAVVYIVTVLISWGCRSVTKRTHRPSMGLNEQFDKLWRTLFECVLTKIVSSVKWMDARWSVGKHERNDAACLPYNGDGGNRREWDVFRLTFEGNKSEMEHIKTVPNQMSFRDLRERRTFVHA